VKKLTYIILLLALAACGDNGFNQEPWLFDLRVSPEVAKVGELVSVQIEFEPALSADVDDDLVADSTHVTITLPPGVDFVADSSDLYGGIFEGFEKRPPNVVQICRSGSRAITYYLAPGELPDDEQARIRLLGRVFEPSGSVSVEAAVQREITDPCFVGPDEREGVELVKVAAVSAP